MSVAERFVRIAARLVPVDARARYREEWLADLDGSVEAGVSRGGVVVGAFVTAVTISRTAPELAGLSLERLFVHRIRIAGALLAGGAILGAGYQAYGGYAQPGMPGTVAAAGLAALVVAAVLASAGVVEFSRAIAVAVRARRFGTVAVLLVTMAFLLTVLVAAPYMLAAAGVLAGPVVLIALAVLIVMFSRGRTVLPAGRRMLLAVGFGMAALATCAVGILHVAVWNPLARVPGLTLDEIYAGLAAAGEATGTRVTLIAWAVLVGLAALTFPVLALAWRSVTTRRLVALGFLLLAATTAIGFVAAFGMGMGLADTFATSGGDAAATGPLLSLLGQGSLVAAVLVAFVRPPAPVAVVQPARS